MSRLVLVPTTVLHAHLVLASRPHGSGAGGEFGRLEERPPRSENPSEGKTRP